VTRILTYCCQSPNFMPSYLSSRASLYTSAASGWDSNLDNGVAAGSNVPVYTLLSSTYPAASFSIPVDAMASGLVPAAPAAKRVKRQAACTLSRGSLSGSTSTGSSSGTSTAPTVTGSTSISSSSANSTSPVSTVTISGSVSVSSANTTAPFPTSTDTGIQTPSGSSCVAIGTATDCAIGTGGMFYSFSLFTNALQ
jgi:hypothetical protein